MSPRKGLLLMFIGALFLSIGGLCVKSIPWNPLAINSFRSIISVCILIGLARLTHDQLKLTPGVIVGACAVCGATTLYIVSTKLTTAGNAVLLQFTAPVFVILFMWIVFHERPDRLDIVACICIFGGVLCFFLDSLGSGRFVGDVLALGSGVAYAWVFLLNELPGGDPLWATILGQSMGALIGLPFLVQQVPTFDGRSLFFAVILGVFQLGLSYACFTTALKYTKPISASLVTGIEPVLNPILVALVVGETLTPLSLLGGAIVFVSIMGYNVLCLRREPKAVAQESEAQPTH